MLAGEAVRWRALRVMITPKVKFENGRASATTLNWSNLSAPTPIYPFAYAGIKLDNASNILGPRVQDTINKFIDSRCYGKH